jgi:hypothetical protein
MKKILTVLVFFLGGILYAQNYQWDLITALRTNDFQTVDSIINQNKNSMTATDKRQVLGFAVNYSFGENAVRVLDIYERHGIRPGGFELYTAINRGQPDVLVQSIIGRGAEPNGEILLLAMEKQRFAMAELFIQRGADVNYHYPMTRNDADGMTPLLYAARWNNFDILQRLVENGALINARSKTGATALSYARGNENEQIVNYLIEKGAVDNGNITNPRPETAAGTGASSVMNNRPLQAGTYRLFGGTMDIRFAGDSAAGTISYIKDGVARAGTYRIEGSNISLVMEGRTFEYIIVSNTSFSGNGEIWFRAGN